MESLIIHKTDEHPEVILDESKNFYCISYRSLPENAIGFYAPIFQWLEEFAKTTTRKEIEFVFNLEYFNTASAKQIAKILLMLEKMTEDIDVLITWKYKKDDVDMMSSGLRFSKLLNVEFQIVEIE